jgi:hypothetical protein
MPTLQLFLPNQQVVNKLPSTQINVLEGMENCRPLANVTIEMSLQE